MSSEKNKTGTVNTEEFRRDMKLYEYAYIRANELHQGQLRKGSNIPYITHPIEVGRKLIQETEDEDIIAAGFLHDTLEDTNYSVEELGNDFGEKVKDLVVFCSEPENTVDATDKQQVDSWKRRKTHSVNKMKGATRDQLLVSLADKCSNLQDLYEDYGLMGDKSWDRFNASYDDIKWYYESMRDAFKDELAETRLFKVFDNLVNELFK